MTKNEFFDRVAVSNDPLLFTQADREKIVHLRGLLGDLSGLRVVEPGCGSGPLTEYLVEWVGPKGRVLAFDSSIGMVTQCRSRLPKSGNLEIVNAAVETIELQPASFDLVILFRVFPHFDDKRAILTRFRQCLAHGGSLVVANLEGSRRLNHLHAGFSEAVRHDHMPCGKGIAKMLEDCGYSVVSVTDTDDIFFAKAIVERQGPTRSRS